MYTLTRMYGMSIEDYALRFFFFIGGLGVIVNTAAVMCKTILKLYLRKPTLQIRSSNMSNSSVNSSLGSNCSGVKYFKNNVGQQNHINLTPLIKHHAAPGASSNMQGNHHSLVTGNKTTSNPRESNDLKLISVMFFSCALETICSAVFGLYSQSTFSPCCNMSAVATGDCLVVSKSIIFQRESLCSLLNTLLLCALSTFPVALFSIKHCFTDWSRSVASSLLFVLSILVSRCFAFFLFPHLLHDGKTSFDFERLISPWLVCFSMCLGIKFTEDFRKSHVKMVSKPTEEIQQNCCSIVNADNMSRRHSLKKFAEKNGPVSKPNKRFMRRSLSDLAFTSDAFMPCVVLMKKQTAEMYKTHTNIGTMPRPPRTRRRASLDVIKENNKVNDARKWSDMMERRRTSLPAILASSKRKAMMSSVLVDTTTLVDVQTTLEDYSNDPSQAAKVIERLQQLLRPYKTDHIKPRQVVWLHDSTTDGSDEDTSGPRHTLGNRPSRVSDWSGAHRDIFSTTTTATGLPTEEPAPEKPVRIKVVKDKTPISGSPFDLSKASPPCGGQLRMGRRSTFPIIQSNVTSFSSSYAGSRKLVSSDYESGDTDDSPARDFPAARSKSVNEMNGCEAPSSQQFFANPESVEHLDSSVLPLFQECEGKIVEEDECCHDSQEEDDGSLFFEDYQGSLLGSVYNWNFQIFDLADQTPCVLSQMAFKLFQDTGLFATFRIPKQEFVNYMIALESGYRLIPYHNRIHAADVLHGCWYLSTQDIPGFQDYYPPLSSDSSDSDSGTGTSQTRQVNNIGHGSLAQSIPALELMSLYLAAAMHDYDHPGRTNAFLVETRHPLAILYNDRSVLENHHASASWELLYSNRNFDFLKNLTTAEWKRLRFLIVEAILATDLKKHFDILSQFTSKSQRPRPAAEDDSDSNCLMKTGINWSADEDRLLVCQMVIKLADIGGPAKHRNLHITWTKAICEEFFIQGDEERELKVPVSPFMDRELPQVAELQRTFINNLIKPIVYIMHKTGVLAGAVEDDSDEALDSAAAQRKSLLLEQLKENLNFWKLNSFASGHEEMNKAFKLALPVDVRLSRRERQNSKSPHSITLHRPTAVPAQACRCGVTQDTDDDVFPPSSLSQPLHLDVVDTSPTAFTSPTNMSRPPKIIVGDDIVDDPK